MFPTLVLFFGLLGLTMATCEETKMGGPSIAVYTGAKMPQVGFGTFLSQPGEVGPAVREALKAGYRHIDCAEAYQNQKEIGEVFAEVFADASSGIKREDVWITSKLAPPMADPTKVRIALQTTLKDLQLDYLDLYLIHQPTPVEPDPTYDGKHRIIGKFMPLRSRGWGLQDVWRSMEAMQKDGLAKHIGVSNYAAQALNDLFMYARVAPAVLQIERHPYHSQKEILQFCKTNNVVVTNYSPLGAPGLPLYSGQDAPLLSNPVVLELAKKHGKTAAQVLIRWGVDTGTTVIPKSVKAHRIVENFDVQDFALGEDDLAALAGLSRQGRMFMQDWMGVPAFL